MKAIRNKKQLFEEGQRLEKSGELEDAAAAYRKIVAADPGDQDVLTRLLVVYRRLKKYREELEVVDAALAGIAWQDKALQRKWIEAHPGAARLGKAVLRKLGSEDVSGYGTDPMVKKLERRREALVKKVGGGKRVRPAAAHAAVRKQVVERRREAAEARKEEAKAKKEEAKARRDAAAARKKEAAEQRRKEAEERNAERQARKEADEKSKPSLFVVSLRYLVSLVRIDALLPRHVAFLNKHYAKGEFLVSGRQEPRTGGIIIARGKNREVIEKIMRQDPFVKGGLASVDILEFKPSKTGKGVKGM
ncbi:MAG TPA: YciI family protein [Puia sp.]